PVPGDMRLRIAVQEQQWRPAPTDKRHDACVFGIDIVTFKPLEHGRGSPSIVWRPQHTPIELGAVVLQGALRTIAMSGAIGVARKEDRTREISALDFHAS